MLLHFQEQALAQIGEEDGLVVFGRGLGALGLMLEYVDRHVFLKSTGSSAVGRKIPLVLALNVGEAVVELSRTQMMSPGAAPRLVNHSYTSAERTEMYSAGGFLAVSAVILQRDLLTNTLHPSAIEGLVVWDAHRVDDAKPEAFILRLYREGNRNGFVKGFTEYPELINRGFHGAEKVMKRLYVQRLFLWPRFHEQVVADVDDKDPVDVVELHQPMFDSMRKIQACIFECVSNCLKELRKASKNSVDLSDLKSRDSMFGPFDEIVARQLEPVRQLTSSRIRGLISELRTLRLLLQNLTRLNVVDFFRYLESLRTTEGMHAGWLVTRVASRAFSLAKSRVFVIQAGNRSANTDENQVFVPVLEENPKWPLLREILTEIVQDFQQSKSPGTKRKVLVMVKEERCIPEVRNCLSEENLNAMMSNLLEQLMKKQGTNIKELFDSYKERSRQQKVSDDQVTLTQLMRDDEIEQIGNGQGENGQVDIVGDGDDTQISTFEETDPVRSEGPRQGNRVDFSLPHQPNLSVTISTYSTVPGNCAALLDELCPQVVVMYDGDLAFVRELECYKARASLDSLRVYFLIYEDSVEERQYVRTVERERGAFEALIRDKAVMLTHADQNGCSDTPVEPSLSRARAPLEVPKSLMGLRGRDSRLNSRPIAVPAGASVVLDTRELRSALPNILHSFGIQLQPVTLEVGDFVLSPKICIERKTIPDLQGSLNSGRLYNQADAMLRHYEHCSLLIECDAERPLTVSSGKELDNEITIMSTMSKLVLLAISFPRLGVLWCRGPHETVGVFAALKSGEPEPDAKAACSYGADSAMTDAEYNQGAIAVLRALPGIDSHNVGRVVERVESVTQLARLDLGELKDLLGVPSGRALHRFLTCTPPPFV